VQPEPAFDDSGLKISAEILSLWDRLHRPGLAASSRGSYRSTLIGLIEKVDGRKCRACGRIGKGAKRLVGIARRSRGNRLVVAQRDADSPPVLICRECVEELGYKEPA